MDTVTKFLFYGIIICIMTRFIWNKRYLIIFSAKYPKAWHIFQIRKLMKSKELLSLCSKPFNELKSYTYLAWLGFELVLFTADPKLCDQILLSPDMLNKSKVYKGLERFFGPGLLTIDEEIWRDHRRKINPFFNNTSLQSFFPAFNRGLRNIRQSFQNMADDGNEYDIEFIIRRVVLGVTLETIMGKVLKEGQLVERSCLEAIERGMEMGAPGFLASLLNLDSLFEYTNIYKSTEELFKGLIMDLLVQKPPASAVGFDDHRNDDETLNNKCFVKQALQLYEAGNFSLKEIIAELKITTAAAFDTTAMAMFCCICMLAIHPDMQSRLFDEISELFPEKDIEIQGDSFDKLPYFDMFIKETIRLFPPGPIVGRRTVRKTQLNEGTVFPKDLQILISVYDLHRSIDLWGPNANQFNPDNFLPENIARRPPGAYIPFLKGSRNCIGQRYALLHLKTVLIGLIREFRFSTNWNYEDLRLGVTITLCFNKNPTIQINRRN